MSVVQDLAKIELKAHMDKLAESGEAVKLAKLTVLPRFEGLSIKVHPAIDVINGKAVIGVTLPCLTVDSEGNQEERELPFLVTSDRQKILAHKETLQPLRWRLAYRIVEFENRWSLQGVKAWLEGATVNPSEVYDAVKQAWQIYLEFDNPDIYDLVTLWTIGTYFFHMFNTYPYLYVGGLKRTGKTKSLTIASLICFNAIFSNNISTASIYRLIQSGRCTLLMDETEKLADKERASELRNMLLAGYKKGLLVYRTEKQKNERLVPEGFEVFSPKIIANIAGIEDILEDRCIPIIMKRGKNPAVINREPNFSDPVWQKVRDYLYMLFLQFFSEVSSVVCDVSAVCVVGETRLSDRDLELWKPILALAMFFDKYNQKLNLTERMIRFAERTVNEKQNESAVENEEYILVETLTKLVQTDGYYQVKAIRDVMAQAYEEEPKWLTTKWLGRALKRLGFKEKRRVGRGREYKFTVKEVKELAERLEVHVPLTTQTTQNTQTTLQEALRTLTEWIIANKDGEGLIDAFALSAKISELGLDPREVIEVLKADGWLFEVTRTGKLGVAK